jgi:hypothetical protein
MYNVHPPLIAGSLGGKWWEARSRVGSGERPAHGDSEYTPLLSILHSGTVQSSSRLPSDDWTRQTASV